MDCPAEKMWVDILTKPLQGLAFRTVRAVLMNCSINYKDEEETKVIRSKTNTSNTPVPPKKMVNGRAISRLSSMYRRSVLGGTGQT